MRGCCKGKREEGRCNGLERSGGMEGKYYWWSTYFIVTEASAVAAMSLEASIFMVARIYVSNVRVLREVNFRCCTRDFKLNSVQC